MHGELPATFRDRGPPTIWSVLAKGGRGFVAGAR